MTKRAGYEMRIATNSQVTGPASKCGGCGAEIPHGEEYGYDPIAMMICCECIEVFENEPCAHSAQILTSPCQNCGCHYDYCERCNQQIGCSQWNGADTVCQDGYCSCHLNEEV